MPKIILRVIASFILSVVISFPVSMYFFGDCSNTEVAISCPSNMMLFMVAFFILIFVIFFPLYYIARKIGTGRIIFYFTLIIGVIAFIVTFLIIPRSIQGGSPGPYKNGQTVLSTSRFLLPSRPLKKNDVVIFNRSNQGVESVALVVGVPGDKVGQNLYYLSHQPANAGVVPAGFFAVRFGESDKTFLVADNQITAVVWYGL